MKLRAYQPKKARIEIIPMIDTIFFLLVFFMIASLAMTTQKGMPVNLPKASAATERPVVRVVLTLASSGTYYIDKTAVDFGGIRTTLARRLKENPGAVVVINCDKTQSWEKGIQLADEAKRAGARFLTIATEPKPLKSSDGLLMRDKVITRAIIISVAVHLVAISFIGRTSSTRLNAAAVPSVHHRLLNVDLVKDPLAVPKPKPAVVVRPHADTQVPEPKPNPISSLVSRVFGQSRPSPAQPTAPRAARPASNSGGALNTGTADNNGDLHGVSSGRTPVGWVSGSDNGRGVGSAHDAGVGTPEPPRPDPPRHIEPTPPPPPPAPKRVTKRVCVLSGLLAGDNCKNTRNESFNEGDEPHRTCDRCKAPEPVQVSRLADQKNPVITHDVRPRIPDSLDEGLSLEVEIEYSVDTDGSVSGVRVVKSSGNRDMDRAVTSAASQWRYSPAVQDGVARRVKVMRSIRVKT